MLTIIGLEKEIKSSQHTSLNIMADLKTAHFRLTLKWIYRTSVSLYISQSYYSHISMKKKNTAKWIGAGWELGGIWLIWKEVLPGKQNSKEIISDLNLPFLAFFSSLSRPPNIQMCPSFIIHVLHAYYGLNSILDFKARGTKAVPRACPKINMLHGSHPSNWRTAKQCWQTLQGVLMWDTLGS